MRAVVFLSESGLEALGTFFLALGIIILIFLICREIVCWYWKINIRIAMVEETNSILQQQAEQLNQIIISMQNQYAQLTNISQMIYAAGVKSGMLYTANTASAPSQTGYAANATPGAAPTAPGYIAGATQNPRYPVS